MTTNDRLEQLRQRRDELNSKLMEVGDMRPGSLTARYRRCGEENCRCAKDGEAGHGPSFSLTRAVAGKTITKVIPQSAVAQTREQIAAYRRFRILTSELVETSEQLCDAQLLASDETGREAKKKGSRRRSQKKSHPRSKRL